MAYATADDVADRMGRSLDESEAQIVEARLDDVELLILSKIPELDANVSAGKPPARLVAMVEADAIIRILRNPDGKVGETDGNYSYQLNWATVSGRLSLMPEEWRMLGLKRGIFVIAPKFTDDTEYVDIPVFYGPSTLYPWWGS